jgi:hypothetical protein
MKRPSSHAWLTTGKAVLRAARGRGATYAFFILLIVLGNGSDLAVCLSTPPGTIVSPPNG